MTKSLARLSPSVAPAIGVARGIGAGALTGALVAAALPFALFLVAIVTGTSFSFFGYEVFSAGPQVGFEGTTGIPYVLIGGLIGGLISVNRRLER
ncbi:MAG: hypothetical protein LBM23_06940 [Propionibacteriaceae bacterium]|nr:hypothetical protein [Propionibacteriaceae bacterium]